VPGFITCDLFGTNLALPFEVTLKGWCQVNTNLLSPNTVVLPPGRLIRVTLEGFYYGVRDLVTNRFFVLSRQFTAFQNTIDGSYNVAYKTGGSMNPDISTVMGLVVPLAPPFNSDNDIANSTQVSEMEEDAPPSDALL